MSLLLGLALTAALAITAHPASGMEDDAAPRHFYATSTSLDPGAAAELAGDDVRHGHCRLYAVRGYNWSAVGADVDIFKKQRTYSVVYISDSRDYAFRPADIARQRKAREFAISYNHVAYKACGPAK